MAPWFRRFLCAGLLLVSFRSLKSENAGLSPVYSISGDARQAVFSRLAAHPEPAKSLPQYRRLDEQVVLTERNPDCWAADLDLSFISTAYFRDGHWQHDFCANLLTSRHVSMAHHASFAAGTRLLFASMKNHLLERTIVKVVHVPNSDIDVGLLDHAVTESVAKPVQIAPVGWFGKRDAASGKFLIDARWAGVPLLCSNRDRFATVQVIAALSPILQVADAGVADRFLSDEERALGHAFFVQPIGGTSGSPLAVLVAGQVYLMGHYTTATPETGPCFPFWREQIQRAILETGVEELLPRLGTPIEVRP